MRGAGGDIGSDDLGVSSLVVYETLSLDGEFGATERPGSVSRLDLTNGETDDTGGVSFPGTMGSTRSEEACAAESPLEGQPEKTFETSREVAEGGQAFQGVHGITE